MLGNSCQHLGAYLLAVVKREDVVGKVRSGQYAMGCALLSLDCPADPQQSSKHPLCPC